MRRKAPLVVALSVALGAVSATAQESPAPAAGAAGQTANYFNPSISMIGNFVGVGGSNRYEDLPNASLRESELGLQAIVDPYARADFFISFSQEQASVEEGYLTFTALPWDLLVKAGRMKVAFGKINTLHPHVWPWVDAPLPMVDLLGGDEGWAGDGVSLAKLIALPGDTFSELTVQAFHADNPGLFATTKRSELAYNGHYRVFRDLSDSTNLDLGLSYGLGPNGTSADATTHLGAFDFTLRWKPLREGTYRSAMLRGELMESRRDQEGGTQSAKGWYLSGDYQLAKRWWAGVRFDSSEHADNAALSDTGEALTVTFWPSEFSQLRGEFRRRRYEGTSLTADGRYTANEVLLQLQFAIGAHGAHPF